MIFHSYSVQNFIVMVRRLSRWQISSAAIRESAKDGLGANDQSMSFIHHLET